MQWKKKRFSITDIEQHAQLWMVLVQSMDGKLLTTCTIAQVRDCHFALPLWKLSLLCSLKQWTSYSQAVHKDLFLEAVEESFASGSYYSTKCWMNSKVMIRWLCSFFILILIRRINCNSCVVKQHASKKFLQVVQGQPSGSSFPISWTQQIYSYDLCAHKLTRRKWSNFTARG